MAKKELPKSAKKAVMKNNNPSPKSTLKRLAKKPAAASLPCDVDSAILAIHRLADAQVLLAERLMKLERKLDMASESSSVMFKNITTDLSGILKNQNTFYSKFLLTRLNLIELSEGKKISISRTEQMEIENSRSVSPDERITRLPQLTKLKLADKKNLH